MCLLKGSSSWLVLKPKVFFFDLKSLADIRGFSPTVLFPCAMQYCFDESLQGKGTSLKSEFRFPARLLSGTLSPRVKSEFRCHLPASSLEPCLPESDLPQLALAAYSDLFCSRPATQSPYTGFRSLPSHSQMPAGQNQMKNFGFHSASFPCSAHSGPS